MIVASIYVFKCQKQDNSVCRQILHELDDTYLLAFSLLRGDGTLKYGDVHEKFNFLEIQELRTLRTCQNHFETILPNFLQDECEI